MDVEFVACPKCRSKNWNDIPNAENVDRTRYKCLRCGYVFRLGACAACKTPNAWVQTVGIDRKGGHRPMYRYQCRGCGRLIGVLIGGGEALA
jgi:transposase-like protein